MGRDFLRRCLTARSRHQAMTGWALRQVLGCDRGFARCPELDAAVRHVAGFARMIKDLSGDRNTLAGWMSAVEADLPQLRSFTAGLRRDLDAVVAGLTLEYNSGAVEGTVNRIKQLKAAMYGRAKPDLLRKLILLA